MTTKPDSATWHNHAEDNGQYSHRHEGGERYHAHADGAAWLCWWVGHSPQKALP
jgi:hypothetical protein